MNFLKLLKVRSYLKNLIILIPVFFSKEIFDTNLINGLFLIFFVLCISASIIYIFNDIIDLEKDRNDIIKKQRPLASKLVSKRGAYLSLTFLISILIIILYFNYNEILINFTLLYLILNFLYTVLLKKFFIIDVMFLSSFYVLRVLFATLYLNLELSYWLLTSVFLIMLMISFGKRLMDIQNNINNPNFKSIYKKDFLKHTIIFLIFINQILYISFMLQPETIVKFGQIFYLSYFAYFLIFIRYFYVLMNGKFTDPVEFFSRDYQFILLFIIYLTTVFKIIY
tara:strand:- start:252 stop:1097 length:846 start_codon:yes stop_codon:yes gene_type:complete